VNNDFTKYQAQTSPHPLGMEVSYAMGSYIYDSNNKNIWILLQAQHLVTNQQE
jgi:hypothetical protein